MFIKKIPHLKNKIFSVALHLLFLSTILKMIKEWRNLQQQCDLSKDMFQYFKVFSARCVDATLLHVPAGL